MERQDSVVSVGIAELKTDIAPKVIRTTLGSCVGVVFYSKIKKFGGILHIMLPTKLHTDMAENSYKYADTAIPKFVEIMEKNHSPIGTYNARIFGGSNMFPTVIKQFKDIGTKNINVVKELLTYFRIPITYEDLGGNLGRTISLYLDTGKIVVKKGIDEESILKL